MITLQIVAAKSWIKCVACSEQVRTDEKYIQVMNNDKPIRGERYCRGCEKYARLNNECDEIPDVCDGEEHLRQMEEYGAYMAAGCASAYWEDKQAGY
jgi:hypothetical protein